MKTFPSSKIRNVALAGHGHAGKTTLAEALLYTSGTINRLGRVEDGNTVCDFDPEEVKRKTSVSLSLAPFEVAGHKVNLIDTPGYADFISDVSAALRVTDFLLFVVSGVEGVEVQTEIIWKMAARLGVPRGFFINKLDRERASFDRTVDALREHFGAGVTLLQLPIGEEASFSGLVDLLADSAFDYADGKSTEIPVPTELGEPVADARAALVEGIVVGEDELMERYLSDEAIAPSELAAALASGVAKGSVFPVLAGSASRLVGIDLLARFLVEVAPAPALDTGADPSVVVFKTIADPYVGKVTLFKALGTVKADTVLANVRSGADERLHQLLVLRGKDQEPTPELAAGDVGAVTKLADTTTGDVLVTRGTAVDAPSFEAAVPVLPLVIRPRSKSDEDKLANALHRVCDEDPALRVERNPETRQTLLWGMGEAHLAIVLERLARKFGVEVDQEEPRVPYRETVTGTAEAEGRYKKQTGGHGQFGVAFLRLEPLARGTGFEFVDKIVGGAIPRQFIPAVEKGVVETMHHGGVLGFPVVDVRVTCFDGKYHTVDSSELSFRMAGSIGFKEAETKAHPVLLEPVSELVITVPEAYQGDVMGDLNSKRARIQSSSSVGDGEREIVAFAPTSEVQRYAIVLRSLTGGRGRFTMSHSHYDPTPPHLADKIRAAAAKDREA